MLTYFIIQIAKSFYNLDLACIAEQKKKKAKTCKGTPFHATMIGDLVDKQLPVVNKNAICIQEFLDKD